MGKDTGSTRIALYYGFLGGGGIERVLLNLARGFLDRGRTVDLVLGKADGPHLSQVPCGVRVVDLDAARQMDHLPKLIRYLRREQPVALLPAGHYANESAILAKYLARVSTRVIISEHNTLSRTLRLKSASKRGLTRCGSRFLYPWADGIVAVSQGVARDLSQMIGLDLDRIRVIYNPVVTPELAEKAGEPIDHPWFHPGEPPVILGVGKLEPQKDFPTLIHAFAKMRQSQRARLMILGWGPDRPQLESLVHDLGLEHEVSLPGYVNNPYAYMAKAAAFALSSAWEGLPTVLIEAMAVGLPVVATDCRSGPAEILHHGRYGVLTPVRDCSALAEAMLRILSGHTPSVDPGWLDQFNVETATQQYLDVVGLI